MKDIFAINDPDVKFLFQLFFIFVFFCFILFIGLASNINELETEIKKIELENKIVRNSCK